MRDEAAKHLRSGAPISTLSIGIEPVDQCPDILSPIRHLRTQQLRCPIPSSPTRGHAADTKRAIAQKKARKVAAIRAGGRVIPSPKRAHVCEQHQVLKTKAATPTLAPAVRDNRNKARPTGVYTHNRTLQLRCPEPLSPHYPNAGLEENAPSTSTSSSSSNRSRSTSRTTSQSHNAVESPVQHLRTQQLRCPLPVSPTNGHSNEQTRTMRLTKVMKVAAIRTFSAVRAASGANKQAQDGSGSSSGGGIGSDLFSKEQRRRPARCHRVRSASTASTLRVAQKMRSPELLLSPRPRCFSPTA
jgi:hypothetical protein